ncbi:MAG: peptidoglycan DD-metalloendopeptidase family protein [Deltaproteobacteria bacterium]|nr:peptidoglycan DD-metalloendopeptidase family protein [Deltaproteobacteria bacterium]
MLSFSQGIFKALILSLAAAIGALSPSFSQAGETTPVGVVLASRLNVRSGPGTRHSVIAVLESGTQVAVVSEKKGWLEVRRGLTRGYVRHLPEYIRILSPDFKGDPKKRRIRLLEETSSALEEDIQKRKGRVQRLSGKESAVLSALDARLKNHALKRLAVLYKLRQMGTFHFLVSARSVHEYLYMEKGFQRILAQDEAVLSALSEKKRTLNRTLNELKEKKQEKLALEDAYGQQMQKMAAEKKKQADLLEAIRSQKALQLASIEDLKRSALRLERILEDLRQRAKKDPSIQPKGGSFSAMKGLLPMPVEGKIIAKFGTYEIPRLRMKARRNGIEIKTTPGSPVKAVFDGKVVFSDWFRGYGNLVIIDHGEGFFTVYAHALELFKKSDEKVESGEVIATAGDAEPDGGPTLYFEVRHHEKPIDPASWLKVN